MIQDRNKTVVYYFEFVPTEMFLLTPTSLFHTSVLINFNLLVFALLIFNSTLFSVPISIHILFLSQFFNFIGSNFIVIKVLMVVG